MTNTSLRLRPAAVAFLTLVTMAAAPATPLLQELPPITYRVRVPDPATQYAEIEAVVPAGKSQSIELMMPVWSPGYYRVEDYAARVDRVAASSPDGAALAVEKSRPNRWRIETRGLP